MDHRSEAHFHEGIKYKPVKQYHRDPVHSKEKDKCPGTTDIHSKERVKNPKSKSKEKRCTLK